MPRPTWTKTTWETGRNVPAPARCMVNGPHSTAARDRWSSISGSSSRATDVGGSRVTCGGIRAACGSPTRSRQPRSTVACGSGMLTTTPRVRVSATGSAARGGQEPDGVVDPSEGAGRDLARPRGSDGEDAVELGRVVQQLTGPPGQRLGEL